MFQTLNKQLKQIQNNLTKTSKIACATLLIATIGFGGSTMLRAFAEPTPSVDTSIRITSSGQSPFDATTYNPSTIADAGTDANNTNNIVRMGDSITYRVDVNLNGKDTTNLVSTVTLDNQANWTTLPSVCLTTSVTPISSISSDKKTLVCNLAASVTQGTKIGYDVIAVSNVNGQNATAASVTAFNTPSCTADLGCIRASVSATADGATPYTGNSADVLITTKFAVDLSKVLPGENPTATPPTFYTPLYNKPNAGATANGHVLQYTIAANAVTGSEKIQGDANGKVSFVLTDTFSTTDPVGNVSGGLLYNWDAATTATGCDKVGTSIGTLTCTQAVAGGPITITVTDVDTNYPDSIGALFNIKLSIWIPTANILTSQDCVANPSSCNINVRNIVTGLDYPTSAPYSNPAGATSGNRLRSVTGIPNYAGVSGVDEPVANNLQDYLLKNVYGGSASIVKSFYNSAPSSLENTGVKVVSKGEIFTSSLQLNSARLSQSNISICEKIDTNNFEFEKILLDSDPSTSFGLYNTANFGVAAGIGGNSYFKTFDQSIGFVDIYHPITNPNGQLKIQYSTSLNGSGSLVDQATAECLDTDIWYDNISTIPGGKGSITKIRWVVLNWEKLGKNILDNYKILDNVFSSITFYFNYNLRVKQTATGYSNGAGLNNIPSYTSGYLNSVKYTAISPTQTNPLDPAFAIKVRNGSADRVVLVDNTMAIAKDTVPAGKVQSAPGATEEYLVSPSLFGGVFGTPTDLTITDTLPAYMDYVPGSLVINTPGDLTTGTANVTTPTISGSTISWTITGITKTASGAGSNMPTFRFKAKFRPETPTGSYLNTVKMTSSDPVLNATALPNGEVTAAKSLLITAPDGYRVTKTELRDLYEVNEKIAFDLNYSRTGAGAYSPGDFIDILPFNGDNSSSAFVKREDTLTPNPATASVYTDTSSDSVAGLAQAPTGTNGESFQYTTAASNTIPLDPCHSANQPSGYVPASASAPCYLQYTLNNNKFVDGLAAGTGIIPWTTSAAVLANVTAIRWATTAHTVGQPTRSVNVVLQPKANKKGDIYCNNFAGRIPEISLQITSNDVCAKVVSGTISGSIWKDNDANATATNTQSEPAMSGVTVKLFKGDGTPYLDPSGVAVTTTTNTSGFYEFKDLPSGTYRTEVVYVATYGKQTYDINGVATNPNNSGDIVLTGPVSNPALLVVSDKSAVNYSYTPPAIISGYSYEDTNNDGIKDAGEKAIDGTTVTLTGKDANNVAITPITVVTNASGFYEFLNLAPGTYTVTETQPKSTAATTTATFPVGTLYQDGKDTAGTGATTQPAVTTSDVQAGIVLAAGQASINNNFGELKPVSISGFVYEDKNNNGIKEATDVAIGGATVTLTGTDINGVTITPIVLTTGTDGSYSFGNLTPGTYTVTETQPASYLDGKDTTGTGATTAGTVTNDKIATIKVTTPGDTSINNNFGEIKAVSLSGFVYEDPNNNGIKESGEKAIDGATVTLTGTDINGQSVTLTAITNATGAYSFAGLTPGTYTVTETQPKATAATATATFPTGTLYIDGKDTVGTGATTQGNSTTNDKLSAITINSGEISINNNFGELVPTAPASIAGYVYHDVNADNINSSGDSQLAGVTVTLTGTTAVGVAITPIVTTTGTDGSYLFSNLQPGTYTVTETQPSGYTNAATNLGTGATTSQGNTATANSISTIQVVAGNASINNNFGETIIPANLISTITGSVYLNPDNNGTQDAGEPNGSIPAGTTVVITSTSNPSITYTATINADGTYLQVVPTGTYTVTVTPPAGYTVSTSTELGAGTGANPTTVTVAAGETKSQGKDGLYMTPVTSSSSSSSSSSSMSSTSSSSSSSSNSSSSSSSMSSSSSSPSSSSSSSSSSPSSTSSSMSSSSSNSSSSSLSSSSSMSSNSISSSSSSSSVSSSSSSSSSSTSSSSAVPPNTIAGTVYVDTNNNGIKEAGEAPISGVTITLTGTDSNGVAITPITVITDAQGNYSFRNLSAGIYKIKQIQPSAYTDGKDTAGTNGSTATVNDEITVNLVAGSTSTVNNFGEIAPANSGSGSGGVITIITNAVSSIVSAITSSTNANTPSISSNSQLAPATVAATLDIDTSTLDLKDPYVCGSHVYGIVNTKPSVIADVNLEFSKGGKVVKTYKLKTNSDGTWKQYLSDLAYGLYNYKVTASYGTLSDTESFDIDHKAPTDCPMSGKAGYTVRTGGSSMIVIFSIMILLASGFAISIAQKQKSNKIDLR